MIIVDKEVVKSVHLKAELAHAQLQLGVNVDVLVLAGPILDKIAELIPGHFEDGLIEEAKKKLAELAGA